MKSHKINERKDNIRKIKETIENTQNNIELSSDLIYVYTTAKHKKSLKDKNERRDDYIDTMQNELKEKLGKNKKKK